MGRTNRDGRSLARKTDAENLAAHLIQLTAISHLSSEILGLEVNVVRERMSGSVAAGRSGERKKRSKKGNYLVYSSFAASAIVAPGRDAGQLLAAGLPGRLYAAAGRRAGAQRPATARSLAQSRQKVLLNLAGAAGASMRARYLSLDNDRLEELVEEVEEQRGAWLGFKTDGRQRISPSRAGDRAARRTFSLADLLAPLNPSTAPMESLIKQRLFLVNNHPVTEEDRAGWRTLLAQQGGAAEQIGQIAGSFGDLLLAAFNPRQARDRARDMRQRKARARLNQRRDRLERVLVERLFSLQHADARDCSATQIDNAGSALGRANQAARRAADRIDPRIPDGTASTNTYYELETGAVGRDYLQHFYRNAAQVVYPSDWETLLGPVHRPHPQADGQPVSAPKSVVRQSHQRNRQRTEVCWASVLQCVDIRHIIDVQHGEETQQSRPFAQQPRGSSGSTASIPTSAGTRTASASTTAIWSTSAWRPRRPPATTIPNLAMAMIGQEDIKWIPTGDTGRMDAVWIVHGLPVTLDRPPGRVPGAV